jgi:hypothetical protein
MQNASDWTDVRNVLNEVKRLNGGQLTAGDEALIRGQRQINRRFFDTISAILETLSPSGEGKTRDPDPLAAVKAEFKKIPGERPPGCATPPEG